VTADLSAHEITQRLAARIVDLSRLLLPKGYREGAEWRCGSIAGDSGDSLGVHLTGTKAGIWCDFSTGQKGNALDLVREVLRLDVRAAIEWALRWLGLQGGEVPMPDRTAPNGALVEAKPVNDHWRKAFSTAHPISRTIAETYLRDARQLGPPVE
jgi:hypothetical protein